MFRLEKSKPQRDFSIVVGASKKDGDISFSNANCKRTRGNGLKLKDTRFGLALRKTLFTRRMLEHRHRQPRELGAAPSPATFKVGWDCEQPDLLEDVLARGHGFAVDDLHCSLLTSSSLASYLVFI